MLLVCLHLNLQLVSWNCFIYSGQRRRAKHFNCFVVVLQLAEQGLLIRRSSCWAMQQAKVEKSLAELDWRWMQASFDLVKVGMLGCLGLKMRRRLQVD